MLTHKKKKPAQKKPQSHGANSNLFFRNFIYNSAASDIPERKKNSWPEITLIDLEVPKVRRNFIIFVLLLKKSFINYVNPSSISARQQNFVGQV